MLARLLLILCACLCASPALAADPTYWEDIRPLLRKHCVVCHCQRNRNELDVSGGLVLDSYDAVLKTPKKLLLHPGKSDQSLLLQLVVTSDTEKRMPLGVPALKEEQIVLLRRWIDSGAKEGQKPDSASPITTTLPPRSRKLDVTLTTTASPPVGVLGQAPVSPLRLSLKIGPLAPVTAVVFSPDGRLLATGTYGCATIWDLQTARPSKVLTNVLAAVNDIRFSPDGKLLAVAGGQPSAKGDLRLYQVSDWKLLAVLPGHEDVVSSVAFSPDGKHLASASYDRTVRIWSCDTFKTERTLTGHADFVYAVAYSPDGQWLASASKDRSVKIVEAATGKSRLTFSGPEQDVLAVAVGPEGQVVSSGYDPALYWWNSKTGERVRTQGGHGTAVYELAFSRDGKLVASAGGDGTLRLWNGGTGVAVRSMAVGSLVYAVGLQPAGKLVASGSFDGLVRVWESDTGRLLATLLLLPPSSLSPTAETGVKGGDYLALTPEGFATGNPELTALGRWQMGKQEVAAAAVWKTLLKPEMVVQALRGATVPAPVFEK